MPDSLPLVLKPRTGKNGRFVRDIDQPGKDVKACANTADSGAPHLDAPPRDVRRLLARHGASLPHYLDAQRWRDVAGSHQRWPRLWSRAPELPGEAP